MTDEKISGALQENVLTLLCFDTESAKLIRNVVSIDLFESKIYQDIASAAMSFLDEYDTAIQEHLPDVLEHELKNKDAKRATLFNRTLENLFSASRHMNAKYIVSKLQEFVDQQKFKQAMLESYDLVEAGKTDEAKVAMQKGMNAQINTFDIGTIFTDTAKSLSFLDKVDDGIPTGIKELDSRGFMPARGTMMVLIAPAKKGKSWFLTHVGKMSMIQRLRVLHVTLEMPEAQVMQRYVQGIFSVSKRDAENAVPKMRRDPAGRFVGVDLEQLLRPTLRDDGVRKHLDAQIKQRFKNDAPLVIKGFPMHSLTIPMYEAYLDGLERFHKFVPDVVLFDYPNLMEMKTSDFRLELGQKFKQIRGIAQKRNHALVTVTQGNRLSSESKTTTDAHVAEDYSIIGTADAIGTYSQTKEEKRLGLARIFVSNARADIDKYTVLITQSYAIGQFCLDSHIMQDDYWDHVAPRVRPPGDEEDE